jgi:Xaa-Pro dipeptidase
VIRTDRRARLFDAMAAHDLDVLVLGRPADIAFATGARQRWTSGNRPFGPGCIAVAATGRTHLLSTWDEGVPPEVSHDDLFGLSWNPANLVASLGRIPGLREAKRVGTGSLSPGFPRLVQALAPEAELVDGTPAIWAARSVKTAEELEAIRGATAVAERVMATLVAALRPGVTEAELRGLYLEQLALAGAPTPPSEAVARIECDRVQLDVGAIVDGYEGGLGRTFTLDGTPVTGSAARRAVDAVIAACRAGATGAELSGAWGAATGAPLPATPLVHGIGLGMEPPIVAAGIGDDVVLRPGMVLSVTGRVDGVLERDLTEIT